MKKFTIFLYLVGFVFLGLAAKKFFVSIKTESELNLYVSVNEAFNVEDLIHSSGYKLYGEEFKLDPNKITALYVITSVSCPVCITEIAKYNQYFIDKNILDKSIQQLVLFSEQNMKKALRLIKTTEFLTPVLYGYDEKYSPFILSYGENLVNRQILLIDNNSSKIFFRTLLPLTKPFDDRYREKIIGEAKKSLLRIIRNSGR